ncbi:hypothetical protein BJX99DRAFT_254784 [Aspergillus californicus]
MPMNWSAEANAKLFLAVLEQIKEQNVKLNMQKLAQYMGPECTNRSIDNQITKLKKMTATDCTAQSASGAPTSPVTPKKRAAPATLKTPTSAKRKAGEKTPTPAKRKAGKKVDTAKEEDEDEEERRIVQEIKEELKEL